ncbi:MAG: hypothetical protein QXX64_01505 [Nitrososphaera sp.]|uniref:hypothetical protein n=1 Tax=Candidatus Nitrososphaera gargensis TaxID=497727 RepID=UPI00164FCC63|nr:hypothetical protein [Candidatus Nitrososphaera gargensis]
MTRAAAVAIIRTKTAEPALKADKLFFIYVAKNKEWQQRQQEDWGYVSSMSRFFKWWAQRYFDVELPVEADILPVIPGKLFDRMSLAYLVRDHSERGNDIYHFYLAYFKPFWTDCNTEGYTAENIGMAWWQRPDSGVSETERYVFYADNNCPRVSHVLAHELLRMKGKTKKDYFGKVHDLWDKHVYKDKPFLYFDSRFKRVRKDDSYRFATLDPAEL